MRSTMKVGRSGLQHMVRCDWKPEGSDYTGSGFCSERFVSSSSINVLIRQLELARWTVTNPRKHNEHHLCFTHSAKSGWRESWDAYNPVKQQEQAPLIKPKKGAVHE